MEHSGWSFICGWAPRADFVFFARERDDLADQDLVATSFYFWDQQHPNPGLRWCIYHEIAHWRAQGMASIKPAGVNRTTVALGSHGQYFEVEPATGAEYVGKIPDLDLIVRRVATIGDVIFATGMGRSVIRRTGRGTWTEFGPGMAVTDQGRIVGFEGIDGFSPDDIYVAGWVGEIWRWLQRSWQRIDSPTNTNLNAVACDHQNNQVYVVGDNGTMLRGIGDQWDVVDTGRAENLQDVAVFDGEVFVATDYRILRLDPAGLVAEDRFIDGDTPETCLHLLAAGDGVVSMGPKDLFSFSGGTWRRIV